MFFSSGDSELLNAFLCHLQHAYKHAKTSFVSQKIKKHNNTFDTCYRAAVLMLYCNRRSVFSNLCYLPDQVRGWTSSTSVIPETHILCVKACMGGRTVGRRLSYSSELTTGKHEEQIAPYCHALGELKIRWPDTIFPFLFHIVQLNQWQRQKTEHP